jgi:rod shape determining protein RodA
MRSKIGPRRLSLNLTIIPLLITLMVISLINLRNADYYSGDLYHQKQIIWYLLGIIVAVVTSLVDFRLFERLAWPIYIGMVVMLLVTLFFGKEVNHSRRWIEIAGFTMQASEYMKIGIILIMAKLLREQHSPEFSSLRHLWKVFLALIGPCLLILAEPDLGTTILIVLVSMSMVFYEGLKMSAFLGMLAALLLVFPVAWQFDLIHEYQKNRVRLWINPEQFKWDPESKKILDKNMQTEQAVWAIGAGGFLGKGHQKGSKARLKYLPEMQTDFVLTTFAEERGFVGCFMLVLLYFLICKWGLRTARLARDRFGVLVAVGVTSYLGWQTFMNIGMVTGLLPVIGITLPFMSYGGSSLMSIMTGVGLLLNIGFFKGRA